MNRMWHLVTRRREALGLPSIVNNTNESNVHAENVGKVVYVNERIEKSNNYDKKFAKAIKQIENSRKQTIKRCDKVISEEFTRFHKKWKQLSIYKQSFVLWP